MQTKIMRLVTLTRTNSESLRLIGCEEISNLARHKEECVVPENIQTPTTEGIGNSRGVGGSEAQEIPEGRGVGP